MSADSAADRVDAENVDELDTLFAEARRPGRTSSFAWRLAIAVTELFHQIRLAWTTEDGESYRRSRQLFEALSNQVLGVVADRDRAFALRAEIQRTEDYWEAEFASENHGEEVFGYCLKLERAIANGTPVGRAIAENDPSSPLSTLADCFKYRNKIGLDVAIEALRDAIRQRKANRDQLWSAAKICRMANVMRPYLEAVT